MAVRRLTRSKVSVKRRTSLSACTYRVTNLKDIQEKTFDTNQKEATCCLPEMASGRLPTGVHFHEMAGY